MPPVPVKEIDSLAETLSQHQAWAVVALLAFALAAVVWMWQRDRNRDGKTTKAIYEAHRVALEKANERQFNASTSALRDLSDVVKQMSAVMVESKNASEKNASALEELRRTIENRRWR